LVVGEYVAQRGLRGGGHAGLQRGHPSGLRGPDQPPLFTAGTELTDRPAGVLAGTAWVNRGGELGTQGPHDRLVPRFPDAPGGGDAPVEVGLGAGILAAQRPQAAAGAVAQRQLILVERVG
jgi:hypothetical protein